MADILLIESDKILATNILKALKKAGHSVEWQVDPQTALDRAEDKLPDVVILDLILAGHGGVEFTYEFRSYPDWQKIPIVLYSSLSAEELRGVVGGFEHLNIAIFLYKPQTGLADLVKAVDKL